MAICYTSFVMHLRKMQIRFASETLIQPFPLGTIKHNFDPLFPADSGVVMECYTICVLPVSRMICRRVSVQNYSWTCTSAEFLDRVCCISVLYHILLVRNQYKLVEYFHFARQLRGVSVTSRYLLCSNNHQMLVFYFLVFLNENYDMRHYFRRSPRLKKKE